MPSQKKTAGKVLDRGEASMYVLLCVPKTSPQRLIISSTSSSDRALNFVCGAVYISQKVHCPGTAVGHRQDERVCLAERAENRFDVVNGRSVHRIERVSAQLFNLQ